MPYMTYAYHVRKDTAMKRRCYALVRVSWNGGAITLALVYMNSEKEWGLTILIELLIINDQQNK